MSSLRITAADHTTLAAICEALEEGGLLEILRALPASKVEVRAQVGGSGLVFLASPCAA